MKELSSKIIVALLLILSINMISCHTNTPKGVDSSIISNPLSADGGNIGKLPMVQFNKTDHDFGIILQGEKVAYTFRVKNIGEADLIINNAKASCGCTVPRYSKEPIAAGEEGSIEVIFNSEGRSGKQLKSITVWTNCQPNTHKLTIVSEIIVPNK